ncbi:amidase [Streptomyces sp. S.PB5]|uniref:amidase n=1 Tax=Streptomyces sp. S.PB5 TaxID=3020844 RepID=UPI0025AFBAF8|nr:amidase [Streptomyces sp. S.PB5]MDN3028096.1 amidase [Streptomyces sp. S.PB5]
MTGLSYQAPWPLRDLVTALAEGTITAEEARARTRRRVAETEAELRAWVTPPAEIATAGAEVDGPLRGVPLGVKDIIDVVGFPTRCGSVLRAGAEPASTDAAVVTAWRRAGAIPAGKTVTTEFAFFAPGPTRNPVDTGHTPGGSSSGSAAAVASGQVPLALGSQTAGSVTRPAAYCGVAALVMSHGRLPNDGVTGLSPSLDAHGFYTARVTDLALAWSALTGARDAGLRSPRPPRVLLWTAQALGVVDPVMAEAVKSAGARLRAAGAVVDPFPEEHLAPELADAHLIVMAYEAARERAQELRVACRLSEPLAALLRGGATVSQADYKGARATVARGRSRLAGLLDTHDVVLGPAAPGVAPIGLTATGDPVLSRPWQALGLPAITVPGLRDAGGLPLGIQVVGRANGEEDLLASACFVESVIRTA